jgi:hypothetical protein
MDTGRIPTSARQVRIAPLLYRWRTLPNFPRSEDPPVAEIKVERKQRNLLPLLLGLLVLLLALWWFLSRNSNDDVATVPADTTAVAAAPVTGAAGTLSDSAAGTVAGDSAALGTVGAAGAATGSASAALGEYTSFIGNNAVERNEDQQHEYTAGGLRRLASAIEALNPAGAARAQVDLIRQKADSLQITSTGDDRHSDMTRAAFTAAAEAMRGLPGANGASTQLQAVTRAAGAVTPGRHMLDQKDQIQTFFDAARDALRAMSGTGAA